MEYRLNQLECDYTQNIICILEKIAYSILYKEILKKKPNKLIQLNLSSYINTKKQNDTQLLKYLLLDNKLKVQIFSQVINLKLTDHKNQSLFWLACNFSRVDAFYLFLNYFPDVNSKDITNSSCLLVAIKRKNFQIINALIEMNIDFINSENNFQENPLITSIELKEISLSNKILVKYLSQSLGINSNRQFSRALSTAILTENLEVVKSLMELDLSLII